MRSAIDRHESAVCHYRCEPFTRGRRHQRIPIARDDQRGVEDSPHLGTQSVVASAATTPPACARRLTREELAAKRANATRRAQRRAVATSEA
jgi:hypothetical protein